MPLSLNLGTLNSWNPLGHSRPLTGLLYLYLSLKSKGLPRQAEVDQGVPGRLRLRIILTFRHYKSGRSSAKRTGRLYPRKNPWYSLSEAESTSGHMVLSGVPRKKSPVTSPGIDPGTSRLVAQCLNHYATPGPFYFLCKCFFLGSTALVPTMAVESPYIWGFEITLKTHHTR